MSMARPVRLPKRAKYRAVPVIFGGIRFASKREARRYAVLKLLEAARQITDLECQPRYPLEVNGTLVCTYVADFSYRKNGRLVVEDCKGFKTPVYRLKAKLFKATHGIEILET